jgi:hypothetical protein
MLYCICSSTAQSTLAKTHNKKRDFVVGSLRNVTGLFFNAQSAARPKAQA